MQIFNDDGSLCEGLRFGNPYRPTPGTIAFDHFDPEGEPSEELWAEVQRVIHTAAATSPAAQVYHAVEFSGNTHGNYATIYYWRSMPDVV